MAIDFTLTPELEALRMRIRAFVADVITPAEHEIDGRAGGEPLTGADRISKLIELRKAAHREGIWLPHMPEDWGGMGLGHVELAMVQAEAARGITRTPDKTTKTMMRKNLKSHCVPGGGRSLIYNSTEMSRNRCCERL